MSGLKVFVITFAALLLLQVAMAGYESFRKSRSRSDLVFFLIYAGFAGALPWVMYS